MTYFLTCMFPLGLFFMILIAMTLASGSVLHSAEAHIVGADIQQWQNKQNNILIQFAYTPEKPIIDTFTELNFSIQDVSTGEHIQNLTGRVVVTNGQRLFKFENISIPNGHFSVKYIFPDDGTHQVLLTLNTDDKLIIPALFNVFVPHQSPPSILNPFPSPPGANNDDLGIWMSKILAVLLPAAGVTAVIVMLKKKPKKHP